MSTLKTHGLDHIQCRLWGFLKRDIHSVMKTFNLI